MSDEAKEAQENQASLLTLTEVSKRTNISMPTLQRYKKLYQDRIPSVGKGRSQRYPEDALEVFNQLKKENVGRRGRPRKNKSGKSAQPTRSAAKKAAASGAKGSDDLLTLTQISKMTNISYPTLLRYVKTHLREIPHKGSGRARRFLPEAVDVFQNLRGQSRRGRKTSSKARDSAVPKDVSQLVARLAKLESSHKDLEKEVKSLRKQLGKPFKISLPVD
jgi:cell division protein FtsB